MNWYIGQEVMHVGYPGKECVKGPFIITALRDSPCGCGVLIETDAPNSFINDFPFMLKLQCGICGKSYFDVPHRFRHEAIFRPLEYNKSEMEEIHKLLQPQENNIQS